MANCRDCKNCSHYSLCNYEEICHYDIDNIKNAKDCSFFQDRSCFVELPIKPGTVLFVPIRNQITKYKITGICVREHGFGSERVLIEGISCSPFYSDISAIGKTAFLTREEAEQALKEREENANQNDT